MIIILFKIALSYFKTVLCAYYMNTFLTPLENRVT